MTWHGLWEGKVQGGVRGCEVGGGGLVSCKQQAIQKRKEQKKDRNQNQTAKGKQYEENWNYHMHPHMTLFFFGGGEALERHAFGTCGFRLCNH